MDETDDLLDEQQENATALEQALKADKPVVILTGPLAVDELFDWLDS